jgi:hypothetical protein
LHARNGPDIPAAGMISSRPPGVLALEPLPVPHTTPPRTALGRWLFQGGSAASEHAEHVTRPWRSVLWLTGVDYFSTLGYQPGIALLAAGAVSPLATAVLVLVTLFGALPIYGQVARRSYSGQGSIAMLERLLPGWKGKLFVLVMLGFASTDFVITMTLSASDAAAHVVENPYAHGIIGEHRVAITLVLLALLAGVFLKGFAEAIGLAVAVGLPYIGLNIVVALRGAWEIWQHPALLSHWSADLALRGSTTQLVIAAGLTFPQLALGMSGFETGVSVMPHVQGEPPDAQDASGVPVGRVRATRKLLASAALIMSVMLLATSFVTTLLVPREAYEKGGPAAGRALAYLAHDMLGPIFGTVYDLSTILILWFAGASAMAGMLNLIPRYLPRFGMAPRWVAYSRPLVLLLFGVDVLVTLVFHADVEAQGGAYATGVLALMVSAAVAVSLSLWNEAREEGRLPIASLYFWGTTAVFGYTLVDNVILRPDGIIISSLFILVTLGLSGLSRYQRATEFRVERMELADHETAALWPEIRGKRVSLVPLRSFEEGHRRDKVEEIQTYYNVHGKLAFLHIYLHDDRSEFATRLRVGVRRWQEHYIVEIHGALAIANSIAYVSEQLDPIAIFLGLTRQNPMAQAFKYLIWGEGEIGLVVYDILVRYWGWSSDEDVRPFIFLMSEGTGKLAGRSSLVTLAGAGGAPSSRLGPRSIRRP